MTIRQFAKSVGHEVVGKLTRHPELEQLSEDDNKDRRYRFYLDEAGNEYWVDTKNHGVSITTADGGVM
jgi:hypothetical protein